MPLSKESLEPLGLELQALAEIQPPDTPGIEFLRALEVQLLTSENSFRVEDIPTEWRTVNPARKEECFTPTAMAARVGEWALGLSGALEKKDWGTQIDRSQALVLLLATLRDEPADLSTWLDRLQAKILALPRPVATVGLAPSEAGAAWFAAAKTRLARAGERVKLDDWTQVPPVAYFLKARDEAGLGSGLSQWEWGWAKKLIAEWERGFADRVGAWRYYLVRPADESYAFGQVINPVEREATGLTVWSTVQQALHQGRAVVAITLNPKIEQFAVEELMLTGLKEGKGHLRARAYFKPARELAVSLRLPGDDDHVLDTFGKYWRTSTAEGLPKSSWVEVLGEIPADAEWKTVAQIIGDLEIELQVKEKEALEKAKRLASRVKRQEWHSEMRRRNEPVKKARRR